MVAAKGAQEPADLRYLDARSVQCPIGRLSEFRVCTEDAEALGTIGGVLISPSLRRLAYFVLQSPGRFLQRHYLLPVEAGAIVQQNPKTLRISARKHELELKAFQPSSVPAFSDADLIKTMFSQNAAA